MSKAIFHTIPFKGGSFIPDTWLLNMPEEVKQKICLEASFRFTAFKNNTLSVLSKHQSDTFHQEIMVHPDHIQICCNCGDKAQKLCSHNIEVLVMIMQAKGNDFFGLFQQFPYTHPAVFQTYFDSSCSYHSITAQPKPEYGIIYNHTPGETIDALEKMPSPDIPLNLEQADEQFHSFAVSVINRSARIPFILPYHGLLSKDQSIVKSFLGFTDPRELKTGLNAEQRLIHAYAQDLIGLLDATTEYEAHSDTDAQNTKDDRNRQIAFNYWQQLLPLMAKQKHVHFYSFSSRIKFHLQPKKLAMHAFNITAEKLGFRLHLKEHEQHFTLSCHAWLNGKNQALHQVFPFHSPFFVSLKQEPDRYYMFPSLREGNIVSDFSASNFSLTILKADFAAFNEKLLKGLATEMEIDYELIGDTAIVMLEMKEKTIALSEAKGYVFFQPSANYSHGLNYPLFTQGISQLELDMGERKLLKRDHPAEQEFRKHFLALHSHFPEQAAQQRFFIPKSSFMEKGWLTDFMDNLAAADITLTGIDAIPGINAIFSPPEIIAKLEANGDAFLLHLKVQFGDIVLTHPEISRALKSGQRSIVLRNGKTAYLPAAFFNRLMPLYSVGKLDSDQISIERFHLPLISSIMENEAAIPMPGKQLNTDLAIPGNGEITPVILPAEVKAELRPYQQKGFHWLCHLYRSGWGGLLADDMGLGKTLQVLAFLQYLKSQDKAQSPNLLVAPTSLLINWQQEAAKFCPDLRIFTFHRSDREKDIKALQGYDLIITSYGVVMADTAFLTAIPFNYLILDEAQSIKNPASLRFSAVMPLQAQNRLALSGTPVENSSTDLYALMTFVNPGFFGTLKRFKQNQSSTLLQMCKPFVLRRTKELVAPELPAKTEMVLWCEMEPAQRKVYEAHRQQYKENLIKRIDTEGLESAKIYVLDALLKLRQLCNSPRLLKSNTPFKGTDCKIEELLLHIKEKTNGHKILVFSQFMGMLALIAERLKEIDVPYLQLDGKTTLKQRANAVNTFQQDENTRVFLISLKAGGTGLNLTAADYVYLVDPWWNPAAEAQAIDRSHRIGQQKPVMAYKMICKDTVEEQILVMQQKKQKLAGELLPTDEGVIKSMKEEELLRLFD